jgi:L-lactate dehydrogenase
MASPQEQHRFDAQALETFARTLLARAGLPEDKAAVVAAVLVEGDLLGHETHGLQLLAGYLEDIASGAMGTDGGPEVLADHGAVLTWDARRLPGPWIMLEALDAACERAQRFGIGAVSVRRSHHIAALAPYARRGAERGMVLLLMTSAPSGGSVAPYGGTAPLFSPSPIGVGFPTGAEPVLVDVSTSITTNGLTSLLAREGRKLPGPWLMDEAGQATDDPSVAVAPRKGTLLPLGGMDAGHKGYGLALMVEAFTAGLGGHGRSDPGPRFGASLFVQVLDPRAFSGAQAFTGQMDWIAARCHENPPLDPARPVRLPGERGLALRREQLAGGVRLHARIVQALSKWAAQLDVPLPAAL